MLFFFFGLATLSGVWGASLRRVAFLDDSMCIRGKARPISRPGCQWVPITFPDQPDCVTQFQCAPTAAVNGEGSQHNGPALCTAVLRPSTPAWCDEESFRPVVNKLGCITSYTCYPSKNAANPSVMQREYAAKPFRNYYLNPYSGSNTGAFAGGFGERYFPTNFRYRYRARS